MKWFQHEADARNDVKIKKLKKKYGAEGYGVYMQLLEVVAENISKDNVSEWGFVDEQHTVDTLADECGVTSKLLLTMFVYMNELNLLHKIDGRLCVPAILPRMDTFFKRHAKKMDSSFDSLSRKKELVEHASKSLRTNFEQTSHIHNNTIHNNTTHDSTTQQSGKTKFSTLCGEYVDKFNEYWKTKAKPTEGRTTKLKQRLNTYTFEEILTALYNMSQSPHHRGINDRGWTATPDFLIRSDEKVDEWLNYKPQQARQLAKLAKKEENHGQSKIRVAG